MNCSPLVTIVCHLLLSLLLLCYSLIMAEKHAKRARARRNVGYTVHKYKDRWKAAVIIGYDADGTMKRKTFTRKTQREAREAAEAFRAQFERGATPTDRDKMLFRNWYEEWIANVEVNRSPNTTRFYRSLFENYVIPEIGNAKMRSITSQHLQRLLNARTKDGRDASAMRRALRACFNAAKRSGIMSLSAAENLQTPRKERVTVGFLTPDEAKRLMQASDSEWIGPLICFGLGTGMRVSEATGLTWQDVDEENRHIHIRKQLQRVNSKLERRPLKSHRSQSLIPLNDLALKAIQAARAQHQAIRSIEPSEFVFLNNEGRPCDPKWVNKHLHRICDKAGVGRIGFHKLRHTTATLMNLAGASAIDIKHQLGHTSLALVNAVYVHPLEESQRLASDRLAKLLLDEDESGA